MNDLISRKAVIDGIEQFRPIEPKRGETSMEAVNRSAWNCAINCLETFIRTMPPSAQPEQRWIPVTERLPDKPGKYLVTVQNGNVYAGTYDKFSKRFQCAAVAWMSLPEPYKGEEK